MIATASDIQAVRPVAINVAAEAIEPFIDDVEKQDVLPAIGAELYFAIDGDRDNTMYTELLHGGTYADCECGAGYTRGLITAIAYLAYARLLIFGDIQYTAFGAVLKQTQYGSKPSEMDKIRTADSAKKIGMDILRTAAAYARAHFSTDKCCGDRRVERPKFIVIKKHLL